MPTPGTGMPSASVTRIRTSRTGTSAMSPKSWTPKPPPFRSFPGDQTLRPWDPGAITVTCTFACLETSRKRPSGPATTTSASPWTIAPGIGAPAVDTTRPE